MAFKIGDRNQQTFLPPTIDDYVLLQDPVRVYDAFVDALNFSELGISLTPLAGAERYDPKRMLKMIIYGYSYGIRTSRPLERACHHNLSFIWLMADLKPDYRTISRFRGHYKDAIKKVLKQCVRMCVDMGLVEGNTLFIDGSKFRANASLDQTITNEQLKKELQSIEKYIDDLVDEAERVDESENNQPSLIEVQEKIANQQQLAERMKQCLTKLEAQKKSSINMTDPDCVTAKSRQGTHAVHNVQCVTDEKHGLIVAADTVGEPNDNNQLLEQIKQSAENIGHQPCTVCADAGYFNPAQTDKVDSNITVVMPSPAQACQDKQSEQAVPAPFNKSNFRYDKELDEYQCPESKRLTHRGIDADKPHRHIYQASSPDCQSCRHFETCTTNKNGRKIIRSEYEDIIKRQEEIYKSQDGQKIYKLRKQRAEHPFGHMKRNLHAGQFLLRGKEKVNAETSILATCFNLTRMITIIGIAQLITHFRCL